MAPTIDRLIQDGRKRSIRETGGERVKRKIVLFAVSMLFVYACRKTEQAGIAASIDCSDHQCRQISGTDINVRSGPGMSNRVIGRLQGGNRVEIVKEQEGEMKVGSLTGHWIEVRFVDQKGKPLSGWVFSEFVLPRDVTPYTLYYDLEENELDDKRKLQSLLELKRKFPETEPGELYDFNVLVENAITILQCWTNRKRDAVPFRSRKEFVAKFHENLASPRADFLQRIVSCEFLWQKACGGTDALFSPISRNEMGEIGKLFQSVDPESADEEHCFQLKGDDGGRVCFGIAEQRGSYYLNNICARD